MMAAVMALSALAIDSMLPALPAIGHDLGVQQANHRQFIITAFMLGFGMAQLFVGALSDRFGRRRLLIGSLLLFVLFSVLAMIAADFATLIAARAAQGAAAAGGRVLVTSIIRDRYTGRQMARVTSLAFIVFLAAPVIAPAAGQAILVVATWHYIFAALAGLSLLLFCWISLRLPETLKPEYRRELTFAQLSASAVEVMRDRQFLGYTLASGLVFGSLMGFINSVQQIMADVFHRPQYLAALFATVACAMGLGSLLNARLVLRLGMRKIGHSALIGFTLIAATHWMIAAAGYDSFPVFVALQAIMMFCFALMGGNFGAMAMENMGHVAGMASSFQGFLSTIVGAAIGATIGQAFDLSTVPIYFGCFLAGSATLVLVYVTEKGRLFVPRHAAAPQVEEGV